MKEALEKVVAVDWNIAGTEKWCDEFDDAMDAARTALSRARGETK